MQKGHTFKPKPSETFKPSETVTQRKAHWALWQEANNMFKDITKAWLAFIQQSLSWNISKSCNESKKTMPFYIIAVQ